MKPLWSTVEHMAQMDPYSDHNILYYWISGDKWETGILVGPVALQSSQCDLSVSLFQFMKFMKRIRDGEVTIENNQVIERSPADLSAQWTNEFSSQSPAARAEEWVQEMNQNLQSEQVQLAMFW